ncbi:MULTISPECIES: glycosyltransferase [Petrimonas]|jgi:glycosyltransferase involved in cell wall biosynthesis|uniref:glycosyltransferase n=1 Tax=Petrimonas TaxID=307628 RepID=UPI0008EC859A|nr:MULTISPECIES: glycosyltransferase [Petrimonas]MDD3561070.1 glycosyltransferase [Petrimonas mucosa]SFU54365.1 Glycosyltransferase involved in cell wall bisynthesis [Porphyromonadaceae bacterium KHP3R9]HHT30874.1 glycosyltransferase [Petrimonas mucosa]
MKVLYVFGGIPPYANALLNKLVDKGVEIVVVIPPEKSAMIGKGVKVIDREEANYRVITDEEKKGVLNKAGFKHLVSILRDEKPDILVAGWPFFLQYFFQPRLRKVLKENNTKFVMREIPFQVPPYGKLGSYYREHPVFDEDMNLLSDGLLFCIRQWFVAKIRKYCYSHADGVLVYSSIGKDILPTYNIPEEMVFVTYNANDSDELLRIREELAGEEPCLPRNSRRVIHIGRLVKWKRVDLLIDAFSRVVRRFPDAELLVVGDGPELENLKKQARDLKIEERVVFTGGVYDNATIGRYLLASSVYVLAGMGGLSINDAMTFSLPVICSVCDGTEHDLVGDGVNGFLFRENDAADLSEKIIALFNDPLLRARMGERSFEIIRDKVNLDSVSDRYIAAFKSILSLCTG